MPSAARQRAGNGKQAGWISWSVSISHTKDHAVAMVTALYDRG